MPQDDRGERQSRRKLMIAYRLHFEKSNLESIAAGQSGKLGKLRFFSSDFGQQIVGSNVRLTEPSRKGGGPVFDMGIYCINAARYLFRAEPTEVWAIGDECINRGGALSQCGRDDRCDNEISRRAPGDLHSKFWLSGCRTVQPSRDEGRADGRSGL